MPSVLWFGGRYWSWAERRDRSRSERIGAEAGPSTAGHLGVCRSARIGTLAVVDDELLVQLVAVDETEATSAVHWLNARSDAAHIEAAERCCAARGLIHYYVTDSSHVVLEVDGTIMAMLASSAQSEPPT